MIARRLRGMIGLAAGWAALGAMSGSLIVLAGMPNVLSHLHDHPRLVLGFVGSVLRRAAPVFTLWGAISGAFFATLLAAAERRQTLSRLPRLRIMIWGATAGAASPLLAWLVGGPRVLLVFPRAVGLSVSIASVLGGAAALATLGLARRRHTGSFHGDPLSERAASDRRVDPSRPAHSPLWPIDRRAHGAVSTKQVVSLEFGDS